MRTCPSVLATLLVLVPAIDASAQQPVGVATPSQSSARSIQVALERDGDRFTLLSAQPKQSAFVRRRVVGDDRLHLVLRDAGQAVLANVEVAPPPRHGSCGFGQVAPVEKPKNILFAVLPDLGSAVASLTFERQVGLERRVVGRVAGTELVPAPSPSVGPTVKTIKQTGPVNNRFDLVILGDAYTAAEQSKFDADAKELVDALFGGGNYGGFEPYKSYKNYFNVHTVFRASAGNDPCNGTANTTYGTRICATGGMALPTGTAQIAIDAQLAPSVDPGAIIVLVNTTSYGGIAQFGQFGAASTNRTLPSGALSPFFRFPYVAVHELGHAFGNLHDEYPQPPSTNLAPAGLPEFPEANVTAVIPVGQMPPRWNYWGDKVTQAYLPGGGGYFGGYVYHPHTQCMMHYMRPHCAVCQEELVKQFYIDSGINPIERPSPSATSLTIGPLDTVEFKFTDPSPFGLVARWFVDTVEKTWTVPRVFGLTLGYGTHTVELRATDPTGTGYPNSFVRRDPNKVLEFNRKWTVTVDQNADARRIWEFLGGTGPFAGHLGAAGPVSHFGDTDGDGAADLLFSGQGTVYLVSGRTGTLRFKITTGALYPTIAGVGDVNGDGLPDIGVLESSDPRLYADKVSLYSGGNGTLLRTSTLPLLSWGYQIQSLRYPQDSATTHVRYAVSRGGSDVYPAPPLVEVHSGATGAIVQTYYPPQTGAKGVAIASGGDQDSDGNDELLVAYEYANTSIVELRSPASATPLVSFTSPWPIGAVACDDLDGDGKREVMLSARPNNGTASVRVYSTDLTQKTLVHRLTISASTTSSSVGLSVDGAGDYDMDGYRDIVIGSTNPNSYGTMEVRSGRDGHVLDTRTSNLQDTCYGGTVANVGDVNDDGLEDIAVSAWRWGRNYGAVRIYTPRLPTLIGSPAEVSVTSGGPHQLDIDCSSSYANHVYWVLGSGSGTIPGFVYGSTRLPLNPDVLFYAMLNLPHDPMYVATVGFLDASGRAQSQLVVPPGALTYLLGAKLHHAAAILDPATGIPVHTTNAAGLRLIQ